MSPNSGRSREIRVKAENPPRWRPETDFEGRFGIARFPERPMWLAADHGGLISQTPAPIRGRFRRILEDQEKYVGAAKTHRDGATKQTTRSAWGGVSRFPEDPMRLTAGPASLIFRTPSPSRVRVRRILADRENSAYATQTHRDWAMGKTTGFSLGFRDFLAILCD